MGNLGLAYTDSGQFAQAIVYHEQALAVQRAIADRREGATLGNLGLAQYGAGGRTAGDWLL